MNKVEIISDAGNTVFSWIWNFLIEFWNISCLMAPWVLFGFLAGGIIAVLVPERFIQKHLGGRGFLAIVKASMIGVPLPLCSCGVIPMSATLKRQGASNGTVASFITSTPQIGFSSVIPAWQVINPLTAIVKTIFAFVTGILVGTMVNFFDTEKVVVKAAKVVETETAVVAKKKNKILEIFQYSFGTLMADVGGTLLFGLLISAIIALALPKDFAAEYVANSHWAKPLIFLVSMPLYVCTNAVIPIGAMFLMKGFSLGTVMVFLIAGPSCSAPMLATLWKIVGRRGTFIYLAVMVVFTLATGWALDVFAASTPVASLTEAHYHGGSDTWFENLCALVMLGAIFFNMLKKYFRVETALSAGQGQILLQVSEMECGHCQQLVTDTLSAIDGVSDVVVDLANGQALVTAEETLLPQMLTALEQAGHKSSKV